MLFSFAGLGYLPLPEVTAISYLAPLLTVVFAAFILKEEVRIFRISAVGLGLVGVFIVVWPKLTFFWRGPTGPCGPVRDAGRGPCANGGDLCSVGANFRTQIGPNRQNPCDCLLFFRHVDRYFAVDDPFWLGVAHVLRSRSFGFSGASGRRWPDFSNLELPRG